jgi:hypothetical protein
MENIQRGTQSYTEKAQRATEKNSMKLCVSSAISVFLKNSAFVRVTRSEHRDVSWITLFLSVRLCVFSVCSV